MLFRSWIIVYGEFAGVGQITRAIGDYESDIFCIDGRYIDLYEEEDPAQIQPMAYDAAETEVEDIWAAGQPDEYIFPDSDSRRLTEGELSVLSQDVLRIAKNEIYARHGRMFASEDLQLYFGSKSWYSGTIPGEQFSESVFNQIEKDNIALIQQYIDQGGTGYAGRGLTFEHPDAIPQMPGIYRYYADPSDLNSLCMELTIEHGGYVYVGFYLGGDQMQRSIILPNMMNDQIYTDESGSISFSCSDYGKYAYYEDNCGVDFSGMYLFVPLCRIILRMPAKRRKEKHWSFGKLWEITIVNRSKEDEEIMKAWKLVSGIISIILFVLVSLQSCAVGLGNTISSNGEFGGSGGIIVAAMMLSGGIVSIATRKSAGNGGNIALLVLFGIGALIGFSLAGSFTDLKIWAGWCAVNAVLAVVSIVTRKKAS